MMKHYSLPMAVKMALTTKLTINNKYQEEFHSTYIHSKASLDKASKKYFSLQRIVPLDYSSFCVLVFKKI